MSNISTVGSIKLCDKALIQQYLAEIRSDSNPRNFLALSYVSGSNDVIGIRASGAFDLEDVRACVDDDSVVWMFWRVIAGDDLSHRIRFITITASGEKLTMFKRTRSMHHSFSVLDNVFGHGHAAYTVSKPEDITEDMILQKLSLSVNYDKTKRVMLTKETGVIKGTNGEAQTTPSDIPVEGQPEQEEQEFEPEAEEQQEQEEFEAQPIETQEQEYEPEQQEPEHVDEDEIDQQVEEELAQNDQLIEENKDEAGLPKEEQNSLLVEDQYEEPCMEEQEAVVNEEEQEAKDLVENDNQEDAPQEASQDSESF